MSLTVEKCLQAWTNSLRQMNAKADIVFFGDSLTYYGDFSSVFPDKVVCNLGLRGDTIQGLVDRVEQVVLLAPHCVYLMVGINDVAKTPISLFREKYRTLLKHIIESNPQAMIIVQGIIPVNNIDYQISCDNDQITEFNDIISDLAACFGVSYFNMFQVFIKKGVLPKPLTRDGIHLNPLGYELWYQLLRKK